MDFEFSSDALMLRDMLRRFLEKEIRPLERNFVSRGCLETKEHDRIRRAIEQMGIWGITVPEEWAGGGLDLITTCLLEEELGKTFIPIELGEVPPMLYTCVGAQIKQFLEPALAGERKAWLALREPGALLPEAWKTCAEHQDGVYIINGSKILAGSPNPDDFLILYANDSAGMTAFLLDMDQVGVSVSSEKEMILELKNCAIPATSVLGEVGQALNLGSLEAPRFWVRIGARYVGLAERMIEITTDYAKDWVNLGEPLQDRPSVQRMLAEMRVKVDSARWMVYHAAWIGDQEKPLQLQAAEVRLLTGEMIQYMVDCTSMIFGGPGPSLAIELQRLIRSPIQAEALEIALRSARSLIARDVLMARIGSES